MRYLMRYLKVLSHRNTELNDVLHLTTVSCLPRSNNVYYRNYLHVVALCYCIRVSCIGLCCGGDDDGGSYGGVDYVVRGYGGMILR